MCRLLLVLALLATTTAGAVASKTVLCTVSEVPTAKITSVDGDDANALFCESWRMSVETGNVGRWSTMPDRCRALMRKYLESERYASDLAVANADSFAFAAQVFASGEGGAKPAWLFDFDATLVSNAAYYAVSGWGLQEFNETSFDEWVYAAKAPALPSTLKLYNELQGLGFYIFILTGRTEPQRTATEDNLLFAGYHSWEQLILRQPNDIGKDAVQFKTERRAALEAEGFKILGNSGDQWSDLIGLPMATRSFKLPNPMYFLG